MERVLIFGLGNIALRHISNIRRLFPGVSIGVVTSRNRKINTQEHLVDTQLSSIESINSFRPDFIIIASPASLHIKDYKKIHSLSVPILIEKPLSSSIDEANLAINLDKQNPRSTVSLGYCLRYLPSLKIVKDIIDNGELGKIFNIHSEVGQYLPDWRKSKDYKHSVSASKNLGGGVLLELSHEFDYLFYLFGVMKLEYSSIDNLGSLALDVDEISDVILRTDSNALCYLHLDFYQKTPCRRCSIIGEKARINWDLIDNSVELITGEKSKIIYSDPEYDKNNMYIDMLKDLLTAHNNKSTAPITLESGSYIVKLISDIKIMAEYE